VKARRTADLLAGFGINTHIDAGTSGYQDLTQVVASIRYVGNGGLHILRDGPMNATYDLTQGTWASVHQQTGVMFDAVIGWTQPSDYSTVLATMTQMASASDKYIFAFEGPNEADVFAKGDQEQAAAFQPQVYSAAHAAGVPAIDISFGAGWCSSPNTPPGCSTTGDYGTVGDLSASVDFANAHTYPSASPRSGNTFQTLNADANLPAPGKPVAITEFGWVTAQAGNWGNVSTTTQAAYVTEGILDAFALGNPYYFYYALYDDGSGNFGLFYDTGVAKPSATAVRVMFQLLGDAGAAAQTFTPASLDYTLAGLPAQTGGVGGYDLLLQKSDKSFWLALWNEQTLNQGTTGQDNTIASVPVTLTLPSAATSLDVFDVLASNTTAIQSATDASSLAMQLPAHPILVKIVMP
jgi:hypothetical protein